MASSGKKGKKTKGKTLALNDFLQDTPGIASIPIRKSSNWADDVENDNDGYETRQKPNVVLPTAPRAARGPDIPEDQIPSQPPYIAYISNLPYDVDEQDISDFFSELNISSMRLPKDAEMGKLKGFGYIEFEDRQSLIGAVSIIDTTLKGRRIRIEVATNSDQDRRRGGRMDMGRDRSDRPEVSTGDWRSGPRSELPSSESDRRGGGFSREGGFSRDRDGPGKERDDRAGAWREGGDHASRDETTSRKDFRDSDRGGFRDGDRGRFGDRDSDRRGGFGGRRNYGDRDGHDRDREGFMRRDRDNRDGGFTRDREGGFSRDREGGFSRDREGGFSRDREGGFSRDREGGFSRDRESGGNYRDNKDGGRDDQPSDREPRTRPKLVLAPRSKPVDETAAQQPAEEKEKEEKKEKPTAASIFGAARPVDTSAKERQIEERLAKEKESKPAPVRDSSRGRDDADSESERAPKKDVWRRRNDDDRDSGRDRKDSPDRRPSSRGPPLRKSVSDEKKGPAPKSDRGPPPPPPPRSEKPPAKKEEKTPSRDPQEREMPKLREQEAPNFVEMNKYAFLEGDTSD